MSIRGAALGCAVILCNLDPAHADVLADCSQTRDAQLRLRACSQIISEPAYAPNDKALAYRSRGNARADAGASAEAASDFSNAIRLRPDDASGYDGRARARLALRNLDGAIADYGEALRLAPGSTAYYTARGHAHYVKGDTKAAIADFDEALRIAPNSPSTLNRRGLAYRRAGDLERAIEDYTAALMLNPIYALAYNNRGYAREAQGRKDAALADFQAAVLLDPSLIGAKEGLKRLGAPAVWFTESERRVAAGKALVEKNCAGCHAVGAKGPSPNARAPEFRNLAARHPSLALREPLSRGIAAPHDEMPKFALSGPEVDTIVAYINSLGVGADWTTAVKRTGPGARRPQAIADSQDLGEADKGLAYARRVCSTCHNVLRSEGPSPNRQAPPFKKIADTPGMSVTALTVWSRTTHRSMPNLIIAPDDMDDLIAYILSLREKR